jgi:hypothetical protein
MIKKFKIVFLYFAILSISTLQMNNQLQACCSEQAISFSHEFIFEKCTPSLDTLWEENSLFLKDAILATLKISPQEELDYLNVLLESNAETIGKQICNSGIEIAQLIKDENKALVLYVQSFDQESILASNLLGKLIKMDQNLFNVIKSHTLLDCISLNKLQMTMKKRLDAIIIGSEAYCLGNFSKAYEEFQIFRKESKKIGYYLNT